MNSDTLKRLLHLYAHETPQTLLLMKWFNITIFLLKLLKITLKRLKFIFLLLILIDEQLNQK